VERNGKDAQQNMERTKEEKDRGKERKYDV